MWVSDFTYEDVRKLLTVIKDTYIMKNKAYGNSADLSYRQFGLTAYLVRLNDKINRYITLTKNNDIYQFNESIEDTLRDAICYCLMAMGSVAAKEVKLPHTFTLAIMDFYINRPDKIIENIEDEIGTESLFGSNLLHACDNDSDIENIRILMLSLIYIYLHDSYRIKPS